MNRRADRVTIVGPLRRNAHRKPPAPESRSPDRRRPSRQTAGLRVGVAERLGDVLQDAIAAIVEDDEDGPRLVMRSAPQSLWRIHRPAIADERGDPALRCQRGANGGGHAAAEHAAAGEEVAARFGRHEILDAAEGRGGIVGDDRVLRQRVERRKYGGVGAERVRAFRQNVHARRFLAPRAGDRARRAGPRPCSCPRVPPGVRRPQ